jgi:hypothetical protein
MLANFLFACVKIYTYIQCWIHFAYVHYWKDSLLYNVINNIVYDVRSFIVDYKVEPPYPYCSISCYDGRFKEFIVHVMGSANICKHFDDFLANVVDVELPKELTFLFIMKVGNIAISRLYCYDREEYSVSDEKSRKHLLSIEYSHPRMDNKIVIELASAFYVVGNEVLSTGFVERYLEYQDNPFIFDSDYSLEIMDSRIKTFTLTSDQYIIFGKTDYQIVRA